MEDELGLGHRALCGADEEADPVDHVHDAFDLAAEVLMSWSVDDVDFVAEIGDSGDFGEDGDALFFFELVAVHGVVLIGAAAGAK